MNRNLRLLGAGLLTIGLGASLPQSAAVGSRGDHQSYRGSLMGLYFDYPGHHLDLERCWRPHGYHFDHRFRHWPGDDGPNYRGERAGGDEDPQDDR